MKNMKNILLLGDSIRQNYQEYVKNNMCQFANVYYPNDNGRFCSYTLRYLHEWIDMLSRHSRIEFDIVHFNCGLWDVLRLANDEIFTSETEYEKLLKRIVYRIKYLCPKAKIVFALTTEVIEPGFTPGINIGQRKNDDIRRYNEIAKKVCAELQIDVNDLWSLSVSLPAEAHSDDVHFETEAGIQALGNQVVCFLKKYCDEKTAKNKIKKFIDIYIPTELCNFRCTYCYLSQRDEKVSGKIEKITHTPQEIREALSLERMGGVCLLNLCAGGETLFGEDILPVIKELVLEGHYVSVITNGTMTKRFEEITRWDKAICEKIFFKFSFHYLELKKRNMFDVFFANIYRVREAG